MTKEEAITNARDLALVRCAAIASTHERCGEFAHPEHGRYGCPTKIITEILGEFRAPTLEEVPDAVPPEDRPQARYLIESLINCASMGTSMPLLPRDAIILAMVFAEGRMKK